MDERLTDINETLAGIARMLDEKLTAVYQRLCVLEARTLDLEDNEPLFLDDDSAEVAAVYAQTGGDDEDD